MPINSLYPATSPYYTTPVVNGKYLSVMVDRPFPAYNSDVYYEIQRVYEYRPDMLAYDLYSDSRLWWVFAARNPNKLGPDPYFNFVTGLGIYIPTLSTLRQTLGI